MFPKYLHNWQWKRLPWDLKRKKSAWFLCHWTQNSFETVHLCWSWSYSTSNISHWVRHHVNLLWSLVQWFPWVFQALARTYHRGIHDRRLHLNGIQFNWNVKCYVHCALIWNDFEIVPIVALATSNDGKSLALEYFTQTKMKMKTKTPIRDMVSTIRFSK